MTDSFEEQVYNAFIERTSAQGRDALKQAGLLGKLIKCGLDSSARMLQEYEKNIRQDHPAPESIDSAIKSYCRNHRNGPVPEVVEELRKADDLMRQYILGEYHVFLRQVDIARTSGIETALNPEARRAVTREVFKTKEDYLAQVRRYNDALAAYQKVPEISLPHEKWGEHPALSILVKPLAAFLIRQNQRLEEKMAKARFSDAEKEAQKIYGA